MLTFFVYVYQRKGLETRERRAGARIKRTGGGPAGQVLFAHPMHNKFQKQFDTTTRAKTGLPKHWALFIFFHFFEICAAKIEAKLTFQ